MRTTARTVAVLATTSLAIGLLGAMAPAGQASSTRRPADAARVPVGLSTMHVLPGATRPATSRRPQQTSPAAEVITGLMRARSGVPLTGLKLPAVTRWQLSHVKAGSHLPSADKASDSTGSISGTVTGDGHPLDHICVLALGRDQSGSRKTTTTGKTGRYPARPSCLAWLAFDQDDRVSSGCPSGAFSGWAPETLHDHDSRSYLYRFLVEHCRVAEPLPRRGTVNAPQPEITPL